VKTRPITILGGLAATAALAVGISSASAASSAKQVTCTATLYSQVPATAAKGFDLGFTSCPKPFGSGLQWDNFVDKVGAANSLTVTGNYKEYYNAGTIHGAYRLTGKTTGVRLKGTASITGGTGAYSHASGSGKLTCTGSASSNKTTCALNLTVTGV
jgi:hypothetical protein